MLEESNNADSTKEEDLPKYQEGTDPSIKKGNEMPHPVLPEKQYRPKKKVPIVNRRGPSEVDRVIKMSRVSNGTHTQQVRRLSEGSISRGTIVRIDRAKGFGFLIDSVGEQRFFHRSAVLDNGFSALTEQQTVEFQVHNDERGARAMKVRPSSSSDRPGKSSPKPQQNVRSEKTPIWKSALSPFRSGTTTPSHSNGTRTKNRNR